MSKPPLHCELRLSVGYGLGRRGLPASTSFRRWVDAALIGKRRSAELAIRLVDAAEGQQLNRDYRGKDTATNVLSFAAELPVGVPLPLLGDLVLCAPVVAKEAAEQGKPIAAHYAHLTVHGVLHLLGMDHQHDAEASAMEAEEARILATLGICNPYT
jgi:probable rRNA maturation factor